VTQAEAILQDEIHRRGPIPFGRFMEVALYHPDCGYYRRNRDPFGKTGDFFTAGQLQPVFGILIAALVRRLRRDLGSPEQFTVVELGAGRGELREALSEFPYIPVELDSGVLPSRLTGVIFSNEFFDALPVDVAVRHGDTFFERLVGCAAGGFVWVDGPPLAGEHAEFARRYAGGAQDGAVVEIHLEALRWLQRIADCLQSGFVLSIDYGYTSRELCRYSAGTLMSYHRHSATEDVFARPGEQDITSHIPFSALQEHGASLGLEFVSLHSLARTLFEAGEEDQFAAALAADNEEDRLQRRLQLKTLLYGLGERFRTLLQRKLPAQ